MHKMKLWGNTVGKYVTKKLHNYVEIPVLVMEQYS